MEGVDLRAVQSKEDVTRCMPSQPQTAADEAVITEVPLTSETALPEDSGISG